MRAGALLQRGRRRTLRVTSRCAWLVSLSPFVLNSHLQTPVNYQAVALTVGSAFAFGAGVYVFKGGDSVRYSCAGTLLWPARRSSQ